MKMFALEKKSVYAQSIRRPHRRITMAKKATKKATKKAAKKATKKKAAKKKAK